MRHGRYHVMCRGMCLRCACLHPKTKTNHPLKQEITHGLAGNAEEEARRVRVFSVRRMKYRFEASFICWKGDLTGLCSQCLVESGFFFLFVYFHPIIFVAVGRATHSH
jgi:hypothetical protein